MEVILMKYKLCPMCNTLVGYHDKFQEIKMRHGRNVWHFYFHENCLQEWRVEKIKEVHNNG